MEDYTMLFPIRPDLDWATKDVLEVFLETALESTCATDRSVSMRHHFCRPFYQVDDGMILVCRRPTRCSTTQARSIDLLLHCRLYRSGHR